MHAIRERRPRARSAGPSLPLGTKPPAHQRLPSRRTHARTRTLSERRISPSSLAAGGAMTWYSCSSRTIGSYPAACAKKDARGRVGARPVTHWRARSSLSYSPYCALARVCVRAPSRHSSGLRCCRLRTGPRAHGSAVGVVCKREKRKREGGRAEGMGEMGGRLSSTSRGGRAEGGRSQCTCGTGEPI